MQLSGRYYNMYIIIETNCQSKVITIKLETSLKENYYYTSADTFIHYSYHIFKIKEIKQSITDMYHLLQFFKQLIEIKIIFKFKYNYLAENKLYCSFI
jgi:hypothetical protein